MPGPFREFYERGRKESRLEWFARSRSFDTLLWRELYAKCLRLLDPQPGERILDAGSSENLYAHQILAKGARYVCLDISLTALRQFQLAHDAPCVVGDIQCLPFKDNAFDKALASEVIEHVPNPLQALTELTRISRQYAIVSTAPFNGLLRKLFFALFVDPAHNKACLEKTGHLFEFEPSFVGEVRKRFIVHAVQGMGVIQFPRTAAPRLLKVKALQETLGPFCAFLDRLVCLLPGSYLLGNRLFLKLSRKP